MSEQLYKHQQYVFVSLDPIHIGTGGYRLGGVDNSIVREPGTNLPKIPGSSLMGAARQYAATYYGKPEAAGLHKNAHNKDSKKCPIIYTFGTAGDSGGGHAGKVSIGDAQILFFPVQSMYGPVWVSTKEILTPLGSDLKSIENESADVALVSEQLISNNNDATINLGWLMLSAKTNLPDINFPKEALNGTPEWKAIKEKIVLVSPKLFSQIVNSNLEVRTSVAINPETGTAEEGALFTYEAIPRATWLWCDIIMDDYAKGFLETSKQYDGKKENNGETLEKNGQPL